MLGSILWSLWKKALYLFWMFHWGILNTFKFDFTVWFFIISYILWRSNFPLQKLLEKNRWEPVKDKKYTILTGQSSSLHSDFSGLSDHFSVKNNIPIVFPCPFNSVNEIMFYGCRLKLNENIVTWIKGAHECENWSTKQTMIAFHQLLIEMSILS